MWLQHFYSNFSAACSMKLSMINSYTFAIHFSSWIYKNIISIQSKCCSWRQFCKNFTWCHEKIRNMYNTKRELRINRRTWFQEFLNEHVQMNHFSSTLNGKNIFQFVEWILNLRTRREVLHIDMDVNGYVFCEFLKWGTRFIWNAIDFCHFSSMK